MTAASSYKSKDNDDDDKSEAASQASIGSNFDALVGGKVGDAIKVLKDRRKSDRINQVFEAVRRNDIEGVKSRLSGGDIFVNETNIDNRSALHIACSEGVVDVVRLLLSMGADPNLLDNFKNTPLNDAVRHKHDRVAEILRQQCNVSLIMQGANAAVKLCKAAAAGNIVDLRRLLDNRVDVNGADYDHRTALHLAAAEGHVQAVEYLLRQGADVSALDRFGGSPLEDAIRHGHKEVQRMLVAAGSRLQGVALACKLCELAAKGDIQGLEVMLECGVYANAADYDGRTALHLAASNAKNTVLHFLLSVDPKIDMNPVDRLGGTPLADAIRHNNRVARTMLEMAGGLVEGDPKLLNLQEAQASRKKKEEKEARYPKMMQLLTSCRETARLAQINQLCQDLHENIPLICDASEELLLKMEKVIEGITILDKEKERKLELRTSRTSGSSIISVGKYLNKEESANIFSVNHLDELEDSAKSLSATAQNALQQLNRGLVMDPRVFLLQPDWKDLLPQVLDEVYTIFSLCSILESTIRVIIKDVKGSV
eukprot:CAMPEP_0196572806 /NCGR_PEP_ID=MMETSP1081-20130531/2786_1 /TAXON_ID=36882 /ORGANISM="Pyramimonas amylifera, Strain CCMP720" /LENGTH=540 /DNA_ID=CAMNT_0041890247 /DNA_START=3 /DNA_END=1625 /DNA_ORIENTATION=+